MFICTSYYANIKNLISNRIIPISISRILPSYYRNLLQYTNLSPSKEILYNYKYSSEYTIEDYTRDFYKILNNLDQDKEYINIHELVLSRFKLEEISGIALICYEQPKEFCHRHIVADWLNIKGYEVYEYKE